MKILTFGSRLRTCSKTRTFPHVAKSNFVTVAGQSVCTNVSVGAVQFNGTCTCIFARHDKLVYSHYHLFTSSSLPLSFHTTLPLSLARSSTSLSCVGFRSKAAKLKTSYKRDYLNIDADVDLQMTGPVFKGASVFM